MTIRGAEGFQQIIGATIGQVNDDAINHVVLFDKNGKFFYTIDAEAGPIGVPVLVMRKHPILKKGAK